MAGRARRRHCNWWAGGDHQPSIADAGDRAANPTCRAGDADAQQHARRPTQGTPRLPTDCRLPGAVARNCGAVGPGATVVSHPERSAETLPKGPPARSAAAPRTGLSRSPWLQAAANPVPVSRPTAGFRVIVAVGECFPDGAQLLLPDTVLRHEAPQRREIDDHPIIKIRVPQGSD